MGGAERGGAAGSAGVERLPPRPRRRAAVEPWLYVSPTLALLFLVVLIPLAVGLGSSLYNLKVAEPFDTRFVGLGHYRELLGDANFWQALENTLRWTFASVALQFTLGFGLALLLERSFPGRGVYQALVFLPWAVPTFLTGYMWAWLFNPVIGPLPSLLVFLGLQTAPHTILADPATSLWGPIIANVWYGVPFFAITLLAALEAVPRDLYEAAAIDGATHWHRFRYITLPMVTSVIAVTVLLRTIWVSNFPDLIFVMTRGGPADSSQTLATYVFTSAYVRLDFGYASTVAAVLLMLLLLYAGLLVRLRSRLLP
jgi:multiple sugar transport system permease protein